MDPETRKQQDDRIIRSRGFHILSRKGEHEAWWVRKGREFSQHKALEIAKRELEAVDRPK